jgi:hypothetical protein
MGLPLHYSSIRMLLVVLAGWQLIVRRGDLSRRAPRANSFLYKTILDAARTRVCPYVDNFAVCLGKVRHL